MKTILVVAALDTKGTEIAFCKEQIEALGAKALLLDGGVLGEPTIKPDITREEVAQAAGTSIEDVRKFPPRLRPWECKHKAPVLLRSVCIRRARFTVYWVSAAVWALPWAPA